MRSESREKEVVSYSRKPKALGVCGDRASIKLLWQRVRGFQCGSTGTVDAKHSWWGSDSYNTFKSNLKPFQHTTVVEAMVVETSSV